MTPTTFQTPELRDNLDNIIQAGAYGKKTAFCNAQNTGVLDYINNNLMYLWTNLIDESTIDSKIATAKAEAITAAETYADGVAATAEANAKTYTDTEKAKCLPLSGGAMTGGGITRDRNTSGISICGGKDYTRGSYLYLTGEDKTGDYGRFQLCARTSQLTEKRLTGQPDGSLTWNGSGHDVEIKSMAFPSRTKVSANITASGQAYTAPANGFVFISVTPSSVGQSVAISVNENIVRQVSQSTSLKINFYVPIKKGDSAYFYYQGNIDFCNFVYAEGEV